MEMPGMVAMSMVIPSKALDDRITSNKHASPNSSKNRGHKKTRAATRSLKWIIIWASPFVVEVMIITHALSSPNYLKIVKTQKSNIKARTPQMLQSACNIQNKKERKNRLTLKQ